MTVANIGESVIKQVQEAIIHTFIKPNRRARWLSTIRKGNRRYRDRLNHCPDLDARFVRWLPSNADVVSLLLSLGAPEECFIMSSVEEQSGKCLKLADAVQQLTYRGTAAIISCIPGRLAYYYDELGKRRALLVREDPGGPVLRKD